MKQDANGIAKELGPDGLRDAIDDAPMLDGVEAGMAEYDRKEAPGPKSNDNTVSLRWHGDINVQTDRLWLVKQLLPEVGVALLSGQWGTAKTFVALDLAAAVMTDRLFAGRRVARRGGVLLFAAEGGFEIPIRLKGLDVDGKGAGEGERLPFVWTEQCPRLLDKSSTVALNAIAKQVAERMLAEWDLPLALIIIDTMSAAAGFNDESSSAEGQTVMNVLNALAQKWKCCVLAVDHFGKMVETGTRGTSAKEGAADAVLALLAERDQSGGVTNPRMAVRKLRGGRTGAETAFSLREVPVGEDRDREPITTCTVVWAGIAAGTAKPSKSPGWPKSLQTFRRALQAVLPDNGVEIRPFGADGPLVRAVEKKLIRGEFYKIYAADGDTEEKRKEAKQKAFRRNIINAADKELIGVREVDGSELVWLIASSPHGAPQP
jgi:hypothetical protein